METKEYRTLDKSSWEDGDWQDEVDKKQYTDESTGLPCLVVRVPHNGALCGYVGIAEGHPLFGVHYNDFYDKGCSLDVHGSVTFTDFCQETKDESVGVCHIPGAVEPDHVWWVGFDCNHICDRAPGMESLHGRATGSGFYRDPSASYKCQQYVEGEIRDLAQQLKALEDTDGKQATSQVFS